MTIDLSSAMKLSSLVLMLMGAWMGVASFSSRTASNVDARIWSISALLVGVTYAIVSLRPSTSVLISVVVANSIGVAGVSGFAVATAKFYGRQVPWLLLGSAYLTFVVLILVTEIFLETNEYRALTTATAYMFAELVAGWIALQGSRAKPSFNKRMFAGLFFAISLINLLRIIDVIIAGRMGYAIFPTGLASVLPFLFFITAPILLTTGFFLLTAERDQSRLHDLAIRDPLTGIFNRRKLDSVIRRLFDARNDTAQSSCILIDVDHFKSVNDRYGHAFGDEVLIGIANCLGQSTRSGDYFGRIGGEEFLVLLPDTPLDIATSVAENLRHQLEQTEFKIDDRNCPVTITLGVACGLPGDRDGWSMVERADAAMYEGKRDGRNVVRFVQDHDLSLTGTFKARVLR